MLTPERIAELRRQAIEQQASADKVNKIGGGMVDGPVMPLPVSVWPDEILPLLTAADERERIAELVKAGMLSSFGSVNLPIVRIAFETIAEARKLHDLLESLTPTQQEPSE